MYEFQSSAISGRKPKEVTYLSDNMLLSLLFLLYLNNAKSLCIFKFLDNNNISRNVPGSPSTQAIAKDFCFFFLMKNERVFLFV